MVKSKYITEEYLDEKLETFKEELKTELKSDLLEIKDEIVKKIKDM